MIFVDATALRHWLDCRELFRLNQVENRVPAKTFIHREWGILVHEAIERFWKGEPFDHNLSKLMEDLNDVHLEKCSPPEVSKWQEMVGYAPDVLATYYDSVEQDSGKIFNNFIEHEWTHENPFGITGLTLCGRMDRVEVGPVLVDTKTASEVGRTWRHDFKQEKLRDIGLSLYDWYLCQIGHAPINVVIEAVIKPYKGKPSRVERIDLPEVIAYRKRFSQQLQWVLRELKHYRDNYETVKPWPMNSSATCHGRFGCCDWLKHCNGTGKMETKPRQEHLACRMTP